MGACSSSESDSDNPIDIINAFLQPGADVSNTAGLLDIQVKVKKKLKVEVFKEIQMLFQNKI